MQSSQFNRQRLSSHQKKKFQFFPSSTRIQMITVFLSRLKFTYMFAVLSLFPLKTLSHFFLYKKPLIKPSQPLFFRSSWDSSFQKKTHLPLKNIFTSPKTNMTMENPSFEDVFPIWKRWFSNVMLVFRGVNFPPTKHIPPSRLAQIAWISWI